MDWKLKDAIRGLELTDNELRTLEWLSDWERQTIENVASIISKAKFQTVNRIYRERGLKPREIGPGAESEGL